MTPPDAEDVLRFWFPAEPIADSAAAGRRLQWWFGGGADAEVIARFSRLLDRAIAGEFEPWATHARSRLALVLVLDQFSRSVFKGTPRAFATRAFRG